jgi:archaeal flagellar protein FlaI
MVKLDEPKKYKIIEEAGEKILKIDYTKNVITPSIETNAFTMSQTINYILDAGAVTRIIFSQREEFVYDESETKLLVELADLIKDLIYRKKILDEKNIGSLASCPKCYPSRYNLLHILVMSEIKEDPIAAYLHLIDVIKQEQIKANSQQTAKCSSCGNTNETYLSVLNYIYSKLANTQLIKIAQPYLAKYNPETREAYKQIFKPIIKPSFLYTKIVTALPPGARVVDSYKLDDTDILVLNIDEEIRPIYHMTPPEYKLIEDKYAILGHAREVITEHKPKKSEFIDPQRTREIFFNVERDLLLDLFKSKGVNIPYDEVERLTDVLIRYTIGFGVIELLLKDPKIQDISINSPASLNPLTVIHADYGECLTNITVTPRDVASWATKLRLMSGRPLDEANPVLDTELLLPGSRSRVAAIQEPLSPSGIAFSFRRHRAKPWTTPLFIKNNMMTPLAAGLLSFIVDGGRTLIIAGTRSAGKTSVLGSLLVEIMRSSRVITVEDTLELPVYELKKLGYDIQSLKTQSVISSAENEISMSDGIRTSLRMGDSCLIVGEVRSTEAIALYEAMRVGALANVVAGTIHGDSPYGVFDRVVNDLKVPKTSFKATDIIVVCNPVKSVSGLESHRRIMSITEVRKDWSDDPLKEKAFVDLMTYNTKTDQLEPTDALIQGESEIIKSIGSRIREWAGDFDAIWQNINLRAKIKQTLVETAETEKNPNILEADFVIKANDEFHKITEAVRKRGGVSDPVKIYDRWKKWLNKELKTL